MKTIKLTIPNQKWSSAIKPSKEKNEDLIFTWIALNGLKTDWKIEKRLSTNKPYILSKICTGDRYGCFNHLSNAKLTAYLLDLG